MTRRGLALLPVDPHLCFASRECVLCRELCQDGPWATGQGGGDAVLCAWGTRGLASPMPLESPSQKSRGSGPALGEIMWPFQAKLVPWFHRAGLCAFLPVLGAPGQAPGFQQSCLFDLGEVQWALPRCFSCRSQLGRHEASLLSRRPNPAGLCAVSGAADPGSSHPWAAQ